ncbi:hypothetical protein BVX97_00190 [bacterium E08(2017)]|nr:hypothetical protein BVX97_00190 [bacterium E08(2017)]
MIIGRIGRIGPIGLISFMFLAVVFKAENCAELFLRGYKVGIDVAISILEILGAMETALERREEHDVTCGKCNMGHGGNISLRRRLAVDILRLYYREGWYA